MVFPAKLWDAISLLLFVLRLSLTLSPVPGLRNPMPTASAAPGVQTLPSPTFWHRLQIECLIATKWHSRWQQHMHWAVEAFGPLYWPALHSAFPSLVVKNCWLLKCGRAVSVASTICCSGLCLCLKYCLLFKAY